MRQRKLLTMGIILLAVALVLIPIRFYLHIEREISDAAELDIHVSYWRHRLFFYVEITSLGSLLAVMFRSRRAYAITIFLLFCQLGMLVYWYYEMMSRELYPRLTFFSLIFSPNAIGIVREYPENFVQAIIAFVLLGLLVWICFVARISAPDRLAGKST